MLLQDTLSSLRLKTSDRGIIKIPAAQHYARDRLAWLGAVSANHHACTRSRQTMTRAFSRYKDSNPLRSARSRERIPIPCRVSYKTRYADRDARCVLSPHGAQDSLRSSFLPRRKTKEASTRHVLSTAAPQPSPKRSERSRLCGAVHDISRSRACARERAFADAAGLWLCAVLLRHYACVCVCIYIYIYMCVRACVYVHTCCCFLCGVRRQC